MVEMQNKNLSVRHQCQLLAVERQRLYYHPRPVNIVNLSVMDFIDRRFTEHPTLGVEAMAEHIFRYMGIVVNEKRVRRLMRQMGLMAIYPKPRTSIPAAVYHKYPCLIGSLTIDKPDVVWCSDITYVRLRGGFMYLVAVMDYYSRYVVSWSVSNSLDSLFCLDALDEALAISKPQVFHSDQGRQYTSSKFIDVLNRAKVKISMSGKGRAFDNILVERLWRTVKYDEIYLHQYGDGHELITALKRYFDYYNNSRLHKSLDYHTPSEVYFSKTVAASKSALSCSSAADTLRRACVIAHSRSSAGPSKTGLSVSQSQGSEETGNKSVTATILCNQNFGIENG
jgi:putative transposase